MTLLSLYLYLSLLFELFLRFPSTLKQFSALILLFVSLTANSAHSLSSPFILIETMPYILTRVSIPLDAAKREALTETYKEIMKTVLGKGENWTMTTFEDNAVILFQGSDKPCAYVEVKVFGEETASTSEKVTEGICAAITAQCAIPADRIYVSHFGTPFWGWNGHNF